MRILKTNHYNKWFRRLKDATAKARINARIRRIALSDGLIGDWRSVGDKVVELRIDSGPGYRIYGHVDGQRFLLLLMGGDKSTQQEDIRKAKVLLRKWEALDGRES